MHVLLTDILTCPVCGPHYGLIVRTDTMQDRRIVDGALGCPNCQRQYPVHGGVANLDPAGSPTGPDDASVAMDIADPEYAVRISALLGLADTNGFALIAGPAARHAVPVAALTERVEIVADAGFASEGDISRMTFGAALPFHDGGLRGIWLSGGAAHALIEEACRSLHPLGRLVLDPAPDDAGARLATAGLSVQAAQDGTILATRSAGSTG